MTDQHNDGGPAFPAAIGYNDLQVGMSLRDMPIQTVAAWEVKRLRDLYIGKPMP